MPSKSQAQHNLMEMAAHNPGAAKRTGVPQSVAQDFVHADKGKKFGGHNLAKQNAQAKALAKRKPKPPPKVDADGDEDGDTYGDGGY